MSNKSLTEAEYQRLDNSEKRQYTKEWSCVCNECGNKWNYLEKVEKEIKSQSMSNALIGLGSCCNPCAVTATSNANTQLSQQLTKLKSCPKCGSSNVTRTAKYFRNQE